MTPSDRLRHLASTASAAHPGLLMLLFSVPLASQLHWLSRHGLHGAWGWRLAIAAAPAVLFYGLCRQAGPAAWFARLPASWERGLAQSWILLPGALLDPLFPAVTLAAWGVGVVAEARELPAAWSRRLNELPRSAVAAGLMALALALIVLRAPELFLEPRFWAEDGPKFRYAYQHGVWESLTFVHEYLLLYVNLLSVVTANLFTVEQAPGVFTWGALLVQLAALLVIVYGNSPFWDTPGRKLVAVLLVLLIPPSAETWLVAVSTQFLFSLTTALILLDAVPGPGARRRGSYRLLLGMAGLTGVLSCLQTPLFAYKWYRLRERELAVQTAILSVACVIQLGIVVWTGGKAERGFGLPTWQDLALIAAGRHVLEPLNIEWAFALWEYVKDALDHLVPAAALAALLVAGIYAWVGRELRGHSGAQLALLAALALVGFSITFALVGGVRVYMVKPFEAMRYFYAPNVVLALCVFAALLRWRGRGGAARSVASAFVLAVLIASGALQYFALHPKSLSVSQENRPKWSVEVARWRADPSYEMAIWPTGWRLKLKPRPGDRP